MKCILEAVAILKHRRRTPRRDPEPCCHNGFPHLYAAGGAAIALTISAWNQQSRMRGAVGKDALNGNFTRVVDGGSLGQHDCRTWRNESVEIGHRPFLPNEGMEEVRAIRRSADDLIPRIHC